MKRAVLLLCTLSLLALCGCGQREIAPSAAAETSVSQAPVSYPEMPESQGLTMPGRSGTAMSPRPSRRSTPSPRIRPWNPSGIRTTKTN